jgi:dTDP-glucose 4,6-dehydratase
VVTGGAGFIGSNLVHYWHQTHVEDQLVVFDSLTYAGRRESLGDLEGDHRFEFVQGDVCNAAAVRACIRGADLVIHLAAESHNDRAIADPLPFARTNVLGTAVLLEEVRKADIPRFHHVSTDEVFGSLELDSPSKFSESTRYDPQGPYAASKAASDHLVRAWTRTYGLKSTISNCGNNFGPFQFPEKLIPLAITSLIRGENVPVYGDGRNVRDWIFVTDHCRALDAIASRGRVGETYIVSAGTQVDNLAVVRTILADLGLGEDRIRFVRDRPGHDRRYALDATKIETDLGWTPHSDFRSALHATIDWYKVHSAWWTPLVKPTVSTP